MAQIVGSEELSQRIAALKRFREMLQAQRDRFREYLAVLDKEQDVIARGDTEALLSYVELEEHIVKDIFNIQKVIDPLERLCRDLAAPGGGAKGAQAEEGTELGGLKAAVEQLKDEAAANAARNRELLSRRMAEIRAEIKDLRGNPYAARQSVYADSGRPLMIDLEG
jgi:DNA repair exonuclease SbcCD ATPase subunit